MATESLDLRNLLEQDRQDIRGLPQRERRERLEALLQDTGFKISPIETHSSWLDFARQRQRSRELGVEGVAVLRGAGCCGVHRGSAAAPQSTQHLAAP